jgi:carbamoyltransferase
LQILGLSGLYHDSAAALIKDGEIIAAAQEERFSRLKHDDSFPVNAITYCLRTGNVSLNELDLIAFYDKPFLKFERLLETYVSFAPAGFQSFSKAMPIWLRNKLFQKDLLSKEFKKIEIDFDCKPKLLFAEHHQSHAASAFYPSPFDEAVVLTIDGVGEWATTSVAMGSGNNLKVIKELHFPHSLGLLYSAFTYYTGFKVNSGEYKLMGLAPYGKPKYVQTIFENLIDVKEDGSFRLDQSYFDYCTGLRMTNKKFDNLFGGPPIKPGELITEREMDLACSIQVVTEEIMLRLTRSLAKETQIKNLCLAGGVALNCVANGKILKEGAFQNIWIQPAAGDAGGALGAALCAYHHHKNQPRSSQSSDHMKGSYLGPEYTDREIQERLEAIGAKFEVLDETELVEKTAIALTESKAIGWFQGRMEFGPRALGGRSILGDPRSPEMQKMLNLKIKYRESFRPFAPSVRQEDVSDWFELNTESPYMLLVAEVAKKRQKKMTAAEEELFGIEKLNVVRSEIPAVTHVDYSARVQTVSEDTNPKYHALLSKFNELTGCPVIANTSFNVRGEPIVCTPEDAFRCFMGCSMEVLSIGNQILYKENQDPSLVLDYKDLFELD